jgi:hypothetical protein
VSFFKRVFGAWQPFAGNSDNVPQRNPGNVAIPPHIQALIEELTTIGNNEAFLAIKPGGRYNDQGRHIRAKEIGTQLHSLGGKALMHRVYDRVECSNVRQLAAVWDGIGDWLY